MAGKGSPLPCPQRMSDFHEILFPVDISYGSSGGPKWKTSVWMADSGYEARVIDWKDTRAEYDISMGIQTQQQMDALTTFFYGRRGRAYGFRFKDWNDYQVRDVFLGYGDYAQSNFQITKTYSSPAHDGTVHEFRRDLRKIAWGSEAGVQIDGEEITRNQGAPQWYGIDYNSGLLRLGAPMWGGFYAGMIAYANIDFITLGEGGTASSYSGGSLQGNGTMYDANSAMAYLAGTFQGTSQGGLRKINVETAAEVAQATMTTMGVPLLNGTNALAGISGVSTDGYVYVAVGAANGVAIAKIDGVTLQYDSHWGAPDPFGNPAVNTSSPSIAGAVSIDNQWLMHMGILGTVELFSTEPLTRVKTLLDTGGVMDNGHVGVCPYRTNGFGIVYNGPVDNTDGNCVLYLYVGGGVGFEALVWGTPTSQARSGHYDLKTGGILLFWENEEGNNADEDSWCGLYHEDAGGFVWKRRMPRQMFGRLNMQQPLNGQLAWVSYAPTFGECLWLLNTEDGELRARRAPYGLGGGDATGHWQAYDPGRKLVIGTNGVARVVNADVQGVPMTPAQELRLGEAEFHVGVRFDTDHLNTKHEYWNTQSWDPIPLVEVRNWDDVDVS